VPLARPARGPRLVLLVALPLLCLVKPAAGAGSAYGFNTYDADKNGKLEPIEFVKVSQLARSEQRLQPRPAAT
jgi:hypothetical protein